MRVKSQLKDAIEAQEKRSQLIGNEIKQMQILAETKGSKIAKIKENASKRDSRIERTRIQKMLDKYQTIWTQNTWNWDQLKSKFSVWFIYTED